MIKYTLKCPDAHVFDGWFGSSSSFDKQKEMGLVSCPFCGSNEVEKTLMTPSVTGTKMQGEILPPLGDDQDSVSEASVPQSEVIEPVPSVIPEPLVHGDETLRAVVEKMRDLRAWVESNADNVGDKFAENARKMHYGEEGRRGIFGKATFDEAQELIDEGVEFLPLPSLPEDNN